MFPLHSSSDHAFILTRIVDREQRPNINYSDNYTFHGPDSAISWDYVRIVKWMVPKINNDLPEDQFDDDGNEPVCPICLDQYSVPHIAKCGHCFCLVCILYHIQTYNEKTSFPKCPCCALPMHAPDLRPVEFTPVTVPTITNVSRRKKVNPTSISSHSSNSMRFVKLHRQKDCSSPYLPLPGLPRRLSPHVVPCSVEDVDDKYCKFNYINAMQYEQLLQCNLQKLVYLQQESLLSPDVSIMEDMVTSLAIQMMQQLIHRAQEDAIAERQLHAQYKNPATGFYSSQIAALFATSNHISAKSEATAHISASLSTSWDYDASVSVSPQESHDFSEESSEVRTLPADQEEQKQRRDRGNSITSCTSAHSTCGSSFQYDPDFHNAGGSIYVADDEYAFYQAEDGSLCFLSGFNMNCLRTEFSVMSPSLSPNEVSHNLDKLTLDEATQQRCHDEPRKLPLPDIVEGTIVEIERLHLTPDFRNRRRFLSHLPLYTDISFVEIDIGHVLSSKTKKIYRKEIHKRNQARISRENAAKLEDERLKQDEQEQINQRKSRMQRIDPMDEFFQPVIPTRTPMETAPNLTLEDFGPALSSSAPTVDDASPSSPVTSPYVPGLSFSQICQSGELFPNANAAPTEFNFPSLGSSPPPSMKKAPPPRPWGNSVKTVSPSTPLESGVVVPPISGKKGKGKKIVLFSTGAHRSDYF
jgi:RING-type zinc-finger